MSAQRREHGGGDARTHDRAGHYLRKRVIAQPYSGPPHGSHKWPGDHENRAEHQGQDDRGAGCDGGMDGHFPRQGDGQRDDQTDEHGDDEGQQLTEATPGRAGSYGGVALSADQVGNAAAIYAEGRAMGVPDYGILIA